MSHHNIQVVQSAYDRLACGDVPGILALLDPQVEVTEAESLPYGGIYHGHTGVQELLGKMFAAWEVFQAHPVRLVADGDEVIAFLQISGKLRGSGQPIDMPALEVFTLHHQKIVAIQPYYWDTAVLAGLWAERSVGV